jgi:hypothetical protein
VFPTSSRPNNWRKTWTSSCGCSRHLHRGTGHKNDIAWLQSPEQSWIILYCTGGWPTPLKNDGVKVNWDDDIFRIWWESHNPLHGSKPPTRRNPSQPASIPASIPPRPAPPLSSHRYWNCSKDMLPSQLYLEGWGKRSLLWYS